MIFCILRDNHGFLGVSLRLNNRGREKDCTGLCHYLDYWDYQSGTRAVVTMNLYQLTNLAIQ